MQQSSAEQIAHYQL